MYAGLRDEHLRYLEKWGLVRPIGGPLFVRGPRRSSVRRPLRSSAGSPLKAILRSLSAEQEGQLALDFQAARPDRAPARVVALPAAAAKEPVLFPAERGDRIAAANQSMAAKYFLEGAELDDGDERDLEGAALAYRRAALFDPQLVPALVNLANIHYERDELVEAEALYEKAIRIDSECFEAYFNLGNIHHDLGALPRRRQRLSRRAC